MKFITTQPCCVLKLTSSHTQPNLHTVLLKKSFTSSSTQKTHVDISICRIARTCYHCSNQKSKENWRVYLPDVKIFEQIVDGRLIQSSLVSLSKLGAFGNRIELHKAQKFPTCLQMSNFQTMPSNFFLLKRPWLINTGYDSISDLINDLIDQH